MDTTTFHIEALVRWRVHDEPGTRQRHFVSISDAEQFLEILKADPTVFSITIGRRPVGAYQVKRVECE